VAPEILRSAGRETDARALQCADVYSFGIIVYEILTRKEPFEDEMISHSIEGN
jgi:serine/threonine protein kinase